MSQRYIRIAKTPDVEKVLSELRTRFSLLNEAEIIKFALSEVHNKEAEAQMEKEQKVRKAYKHAMAKGRKVGIKLMKAAGLDPKKVTEQEFYDRFLDTHKHSA